LEEVVTRYPTDAAAPRAWFMLGESYRKSAGEIAAAIAKDPGIARRADLEKARAERLLLAAQAYSRVIVWLDVEATAETGMKSALGRKLTVLEEQYLRSSYMNRAECYFERGEYPQAVKLYDEVSGRFSEETLAVEAYVQIVKAYLAMKQPAQASAAAERGRWVLKRVPDAAFSQGVQRLEYERLLAVRPP
jgi:tetratricopeptide (TPR) repeat protein